MQQLSHAMHYNTESAMLWAVLIFWLAPMCLGYLCGWLRHRSE